MLQECVHLLCIIHLTSCLTFKHVCIKEAHSVCHSGYLLLHSLCIPNRNLLNEKAVCCTHLFFFLKRLPFIQVCSDSQLNTSSFFQHQTDTTVAMCQENKKIQDNPFFKTKFLFLFNIKIYKLMEVLKSYFIKIMKMFW